jgi:tetratricopeptide (TPR) repeat protein
LIIQEDLSIIQNFGILPISQPVQIPQEDSIKHFVNWCISQGAVAESDKVKHIDSILESLAELWPAAWLSVAKYRQQHNFVRERIDYALRRAVEENPSNKEAWLERADFARLYGDDATFVSSRVRAIEIDPSDVSLIYAVSYDLIRYISKRTSEIPVARRSVYLASLRDHMVNMVDLLDSTGLSRLAWLYLLEANKEEAWKYASQGLKKKQNDQDCYKIIERLKESGFKPSAKT